MDMKVKKIAIVCSTLFALSGCMDDPYSYPKDNEGGTGGGGTGGGGTGGNITQIYGEGADGSFVLTATDSADVSADVDGQENSSLANIQVIGDYANQAPLTVTVTQQEKASVQFTSAAGVDYSEASADGEGTVMFDVTVKGMASGSHKPVMVTMKSADGKAASVDISSSLSAYSGTDFVHTVKIPLSCFSTAGVDFKNIEQPFSLNMSSNTEFAMSNVRVQAASSGDTPGTNNVLECTDKDKTELLTDAESIVYQRDADAPGAPYADGWAYHFVNEMNGIAYYPENVPASGATGGFAGNESIAGAGKMTHLSFIIKEDAPILKDISQFVDKGELQFYLWREQNSHAPHPTGNFQIKFDTPMKNEADAPSPGNYGYPPSNVLTIASADYNWDAVNLVTIPVRDFVTKNGEVDINLVKHIKKVVIMPEKVDDRGYSSAGMKYAIADLKFVMNP